MSVLIRLYPQAWRDRYEAEVLDLLAHRPGSVRDAVDLVRGALDAHLHPQSGPAIPWTWRLPGVLVLVAGLLWLATYAAALVRAEPAVGTLLGLGMFAMFIALPGDYLRAFRRQVVLGLSAFVLLTIATAVAGRADAWPVASLVGLVGLLVLLGGSLTLVAIRAGLSSRSRWIALVGLVVVPALGAIGVATGGAVGGALLIVLYPLAWIVLGVRLIVRGAETVADPTPASAATGAARPEVPA
jgi:hypothetical protein